MKNGMIAQQYIPGDSFLHRLDAKGKFFSFLILIAAVILTDSVEGYLLLFPAVFALLLLSKLPFAASLGMIRRMSWFFVIIFLLNLLFFEAEDPYWHKWIFSLSAEGAINGANVVLRLAVILTLSNILIMTTPPLEIMSGIEALLRPLRVVRIPVESAAMILSAAVQFIPTLLREADTIKKAQIARGARFESKKPREYAAALLPLLVPVFISSFKRADELSLAMEARGYRNARDRTPKNITPISGEGWLALVVTAALCAAEIWI